jgi:hypothetical protein
MGQTERLKPYGPKRPSFPDLLSLSLSARNQTPQPLHSSAAPASLPTPPRCCAPPLASSARYSTRRSFPLVPPPSFQLIPLKLACVAAPRQQRGGSRGATALRCRCRVLAAAPSPRPRPPAAPPRQTHPQPHPDHHAPQRHPHRLRGRSGNTDLTSHRIVPQANGARR